MSILCSLPHGPTGLPKGFSIQRILQRVRMSDVWRGRLDESQRHLLDDLSTEATRAGICPNHRYILCEFVASSLVGGRSATRQE
jgi:hypothetical protein